MSITSPSHVITIALSALGRGEVSHILVENMRIGWYTSENKNYISDKTDVLWNVKMHNQNQSDRQQEPDLQNISYRRAEKEMKTGDM
ncbi:hypothetical protein [Bacillus cereus]|uniref:hypothetical protein n=1 Tax=Bacillus cereus TaxID=1396 RepID=UPI0018CD5E17|nr:hypothetical protein [Bacillus cereus]